MRNPLLTTAAVLALCGLAIGAPKATDPKVARFEGLLQKVQSNPGATKDAEVIELLKLSAELGRPYSASLSIRGYLSHNYQPSPELLLATAEAAYRAGDYTFAVARYKNYIAAASPSKEVGRAGGVLCTLLVDFLGAEEDAYQFIRNNAQKLRQDPSARRFDSWFLTRARGQSDYAGLAKLLSVAMADKMPLEQERLYYWSHLDWLTKEVSQAATGQYEALPYCRKIVPLIRNDNVRQKRLALVVANLAFRAGSAGKDEEALERDFALVARAARDYLAAAPTAEALEEVLGVLAGGIGRFDTRAWEQQQTEKRKLFASAFAKLTDTEKAAMLEWNGGDRCGYLASPEQWVELGTASPAVFSRSKALRHIPLPTQADTRDEYKKLAAICRGAPSPDAAVVSALASSDSLNGVIDHLMANDSWHLRTDDYSALLNHKIFPAWRKMAEAAKKELPPDTFEQAWLHFGSKYVCSSPIAIYDPEAVKQYVWAAWRIGSDDRMDKSGFAKHVASLAWAPFENIRNRRSGRNEVFGQLNTEVRRWSEDLRKKAKQKGKDKKPLIDPARLAQIGQVQDALRKAREQADPSKAPNELCKAMAQAVLAERGRDDAERIKADRRIYALVKDYPSRKTPCGMDAFHRITSSYQRGFANLDFQLEMLADQLASFKPGDSEERIDRIYSSIFTNRPDWGPRQTQTKGRDNSLKVNAVIGKAVAGLADKGLFSAKLFDWFRNTRLGRNWNGGKAGADVFAKVIDKRLFQKADYRADPSCLSATTSYMRLIRHEFPVLSAKYPVETWFDDMYVQEAQKAHFLDWSYWEYGRDEKGKVVAAAAKILAGDRLPLGADDAEGVYSIRALDRWMNVALKADKAAREALLAKCNAAYGKTRFDAYAMGYAHFANVDKPLGRKEFFNHLRTYVQRAAEAPARIGMPALTPLKDITAKDLTDEELGVLVDMFTRAPSPLWPKDWQFDSAVLLVHEALTARGRQADLFPLIGHFWKVVRDTRDYSFSKKMVALVDGLRKGRQRDLALAHSTVALALTQNALSDDMRAALGGVRTWALAEMGGIIPVPKGHPLRALYEAQLAFLTGKYQTAWETYLANSRRLQTAYREFDPQFCIWVIERNTEFKDFDTAEALAKEMLTWFDEVSERFEAEVRARLQLAYANIALARDDRPRARALYERIVAAKEFAGTRSQLDAELKIADVDTIDGNYDRAIERLESLARRKDRYLQTEAAYHMAMVKYAQEEYTEAKDELETVFTLSPDHAEARILEGRVNLKLKKLEQPTDIDLGEKIGRKFIVPGRPVRVSLVDQNLSVVRKATEIEIRVWTDSGDEELFVLTPFGDSKTKFKGQIATELAPVKKGDHTIQVIGKDHVHYAFSPRFAEAQKIENNTPYTLEVATDAELYVSSGTILTKEQREAEALEKLIRKRLNPDEQEDNKTPLSTVRAADQIKPGNKINVRVVDADRGETRGKDTLTVRLATSSGDGIKAFTLTETTDHSGVFEAAVPTEPAQATAQASDSQEGAEANFAISAKAYPAWVGLPKPSKSRPKTFSIDLNDNVSLGKMQVVAKEPSRKLKSFLVQTSFNGRDFTTVGAWPEKFVPWNGAATLEYARFIPPDEGGRRGQVTAPKTIAEFHDYLEQGYIREGQQKLSASIKTLAANWDYKLDGRGRTIGLDSNKLNKRYYVAHMRAAFYQERRQIRTFTLHPKGDPPAKETPVTYLLAVDGEGTSRPRGRQADDYAIEVQRALGKGVHRVDVYVFAHQNGNPNFEVTCDTDKPPYEVPCPADMLDVAKHPEISKGLARETAAVTAANDATTFDIAFPADARARVVRLLITDFEADAPAINKIRLTDASGKHVLPTKLDFMDQRKNQTLEIVPGDRITVTYEDPKVLTRGSEQHEAFLTATYTNATVSACFVNYTLAGDGERTANYVGMRRFDPGDKINVFIQDPDCDVTDKLDTVKFTARTSEGKPIELTALETEEHSGVFLGALFPIKGQPKRKSELTVKEGDDVILTYLDRENTDPGIPWNRTAAVEQVWFEPPEVRLYKVTSLTLEEADKLAGRTGKAPARRAGRPTGELAAATEVVTPRRTLLAVRPDQPSQDKPTDVVIGGPLLVEVLFPAIAKSSQSECTIYVQTSSGRKKFGKPTSPEAFDPNVPGTLKLARTPGDSGPGEVPPGYREVIVRGNPYALAALDDGRFTFSVPMKLGSVPDKTLIDAEAEAAAAGAAAEPLALSINGEDEVFIGLHFKDDKGASHWVTRKVTLGGDFFFDVMDRRYQEALAGAYVGEHVYFRVIDPTRDTSDEKELATIELTTKSGKARKLDLIETYSHSGIFKGLVRLVHADEKGAAGDVGTMPVVYGDELTATYAQPKTQGSQKVAVTIFKGSDGKVVPFTKRFKDPAVAVETQFMIAEAYFELAKRHRQLGQEDLARREIAEGRKLLEEAIRDYPNTSARAQAEYLLADLSLEYGNDAVKADDKKKHYLDAIARYSDIVATYPDSEYAPKAQFRKALAYEKMEMLDEACEEYVKLSYRYPDNPLVAETIARLGQYFLNKGRGIRAEMEKETDAVKREKARLRAVEMFKTAGQVFGRLSVRFPNHKLAGKTLLLSAQCFMQAEDYPTAVKGYMKVIKAPDMNKDLIAEAMYWCGHSHMESNDLVKAYQMFKKLTWDYPATKWAKFARGRLADERLSRIEE